MKNISQILSIRGFEKFFENHERHLFMADAADVKTALEYAKDDRASGRRGWSRDKKWLFHGRIPRSTWFRAPEAWNKLNVNKMDRNERDNLKTAYFNVFTKFNSRG